MLENGLISLEAKGRRRFKASITERGREFLTHYRACNKLFPADG
jgi:predicted transcriptional regulator